MFSYEIGGGKRMIDESLEVKETGVILNLDEWRAGARNMDIFLAVHNMEERGVYAITVDGEEWSVPSLQKFSFSVKMGNCMEW